MKVVVKELEKVARGYDRMANEVFGKNESEYEYNRLTLLRDKFTEAIKILSDKNCTGENNCNLDIVSKEKRSETTVICRKCKGYGWYIPSDRVPVTCEACNGTGN